MLPLNPRRVLCAKYARHVFQFRLREIINGGFAIRAPGYKKQTPATSDVPVEAELAKQPRVSVILLNVWIHMGSVGRCDVLPTESAPLT